MSSMIDDLFTVKESTGQAIYEPGKGLTPFRWQTYRQTACKSRRGVRATFTRLLNDWRTDLRAGEWDSRLREERWTDDGMGVFLFYQYRGSAYHGFVFLRKEGGE